MLIKEIAQQYGSRVKFVSENWGDSKLAEHYGIAKYPIVFVDDILIAQPDDFGWFGAKGKYTPWREPVNHTRFKEDLRRMIDLVLSGRKDAAGRTQVRIEDAGPKALPQLTAMDRAGRKVDFAALSGKVVIVEFWASWCVPCRATLKWFAELKQQYGAQIELIAVTVESPDKDVQEVAQTLHPSINIVPVSAEIINHFGDITSVPTMYIFDRNGKTAGVFFGAPQSLHQQVAKLLESLTP